MKNRTFLRENFVIQGTDIQRTELIQAEHGKLALYTCPAPTEGRSNEDRVAVYDTGSDQLVLIIADGAGGHADGGEASAIVIAEINKALDSSHNEEGDLRGAILTGIENANRRIIDSTNGAASTVAVVEIHGRKIRTYHAGDSEVLVTGLRGKIKHQTLTHSPVSYAVEAGLLNEDEAIMHEDRHIVSTILGFDDMHISISTHTQLDAYDRLIVATDGVFDNMHKDEIIEIIRKGPLEKCSRHLIEQVNHRMDGSDPNNPSKCDDVSFILFELNRLKV